MALIKNHPMTWAWGAGILGVLLVITGFLSQQTTSPNSKQKCTPSQYTWAPIAIGFIMVFAGMVTLMKLNKLKKAGMMGASEASISPEPTPSDMM